MPIIKMAFISLTLFYMVSVNADSWIYSDPFVPNGKTLIIDTQPRNIIRKKHLRTEWYSCKDDGYICLLSGLLSFVFPKDSIYEKQWVNHDITYSIIDQKDVKLVNNNFKNVFHISAKYKGSEDFIYLYSYENGLIGILELSDNYPGILILESNCGFGASDECNN